MSAVRVTIRIMTWTGMAIIAGSAALFAHGWLRQVPFERFAVSGATNASIEDVERLAAVERTAPLYDVKPRVIADRVQRHAWVKKASVTRWPNGTLRVNVVERTPVLLVLSRNGSPAYYLDEGGFPLPLLPGLAFNVPLIRGFGATAHPLRPVSDARVRALAADLAAVDADELALLSEFELRDQDMWLRTSATEQGHSIPVRLGQEGYREKIARVHAFWHRAVLTQPDRQFQLIDLRFDGQIVTRETSL